jgi:thymidine phosphorylase
MPVGPTAKVRSITEATRLRKLFEYVGTAVGLEITVLVTDGTQPIGRGIGPMLEARDVMAVLRNASDAPVDLKERAILLAGALLDFDPALKGGEGVRRAREILESGKAFAAMEAIIAAQGPPPQSCEIGNLTKEVLAPTAGTIGEIDCYRIARIARLAGAPNSKGAGIDLLRKVGDRVEKGETLYRIHAAVETDFAFATDMAEEVNGYEIDA